MVIPSLADGSDPGAPGKKFFEKFEGVEADWRAKFLSSVSWLVTDYFQQRHYRR
jgi:hypothetical protein